MNAPPPRRVLLTSVFKPFSVHDAYNAPDNLIEHSLCHRAFTRRQGMFTVDQQCLNYALHLLASNVAAHATVLEYPSLEELAAELDRGYDVVGVSCGASTLGKARRVCELVKARTPAARTVVGGGGTMAIGELVEPFADHTCRGEGVRFMRELLGEPPGRVEAPVVPSVHRANRLLGLPAHAPNYVVAVALGCTRACEFCATSHHFGGQRVPLFETGAELFAFMQRVERHLRRRGERPSSIGFMIFDENFLMNRPLVEELRRLNREQLLGGGTQYLSFVFSDAAVLAGYTAEQLLELGVDSVWVGVESPAVGGLEKLRGVDLRRLIRELTSSGIKVFASLMAGLEQHTEELLREDMAFALGLGATAYQYAPVDPIPGTPYYRRLRRQGLIPDRDLSYLSMSHYNLLHPTLTEQRVLRLIDRFYDRDHRLNGPMVYRFLEGRYRGYLRHHASANPCARARAALFARDLLRGFPVLLLGETFGPGAGSRRRFRRLRRRVQRHFRRAAVLGELLAGRLDARDGGLYLATSLPGARQLVRQALAVNVVLRDPRTRGGMLELLTGWQPAVERARRGMVPWDQPTTVRTEYPARACRRES